MTDQIKSGLCQTCPTPSACGFHMTCLAQVSRTPAKAGDDGEAAALRIAWWNDMRDRGVSQDIAIAKINAALSRSRSRGVSEMHSYNCDCEWCWLGVTTGKRVEMPRWRFLGPSEVWRDDSTATRDLYLFGFRVWRVHFTHSTWLPHDLSALHGDQEG